MRSTMVKKCQHFFNNQKSTIYLAKLEHTLKHITSGGSPMKWVWVLAGRASGHRP